jgi:trimeric autotransporter adhesin
MAGASAAALLLAGSALAQTAGTDYSQPTQYTAAESGSAASVVDQVGDSNTATVNQAANGNSSVILQDAPVGSPTTADPNAGRSNGSHATVNQAGTGDRALTIQNAAPGVNVYAGATSTTNQSGTNESAFTYQNGLISTATINQNTNAASQGGGNVLGVDGRSSEASAQADVNYAESLSGAALDGWTENKGSYGATIVQDSAGNGGYTVDTATINQDNTGARGNNAALITQIAAQGDTATVQQYDTAQSGAAILQSGANDYANASIYQTGGRNNSATIQQTGGDFNGDGDLANVYQSGNGQEARIAQGQHGNTGTVVQSVGDDKAFARITQNGQMGNALVDQAGTGADYAMTTQSDVGSTANTYQTGGMDVSLITQSAGGGSNTANVYQSAAGAYSVVNQMGTGNVATVNQFAGASSMTAALK